MNLKRFVQLFICYFVSMVVAVLLTNLFNISTMPFYLLVASIIGYITLTIPLVVMTIKKKQIVPRVDLLKGASDDWQCSLSTKKVKKMVHSLSYLSDTYLWLVVVY